MTSCFAPLSFFSLSIDDTFHVVLPHFLHGPTGSRCPSVYVWCLQLLHVKKRFFVLMRSTWWPFSRHSFGFASVKRLHCVRVNV